jgi:hypothetical protein
LRRLYEALVHPLATRATQGAWYRAGRLVSLDGSCLDVADTAANRSTFGMPGASRGASAFPPLRFVTRVANGTHVLFGAQLGRAAEGETTLAQTVLAALRPGMLGLADRPVFGHALWQAAATGADLLWRVKHTLRLPRETVLADGASLGRSIPATRTGGPAPASGGAWSRTGWRAWPRPSRAIGCSPRGLIPPRRQAMNWRRSIMSGGKSKRRLMSGKRIGAAPGSSCAAQPPTWYVRSFTG